MKKTVLLFLLLPALCFAGEYVTTPYDIVLSEPTTDQVEKIEISFKYASDGNHFAVIIYRILNQDKTKTLYEFSFQLAGQDFTDFIAGYGATLASRAEAAISQDLQDRFTTQAKP